MARRIRRAARLSALALTCAAAASAAPPRSEGTARCTAGHVASLLSRVAADPSVKEIGIDSVRPVAGPVPHCEVIGHTVTQNPGPNTVGWSVLLPDRGFARRYLVQGQGGQGGRILTADNPATQRLLARGIAFSSSDTGAKGPAGRWAVTSDPAELIDRDHRGAHVSVLATKAITRAYYGMRATDRLFAYDTGCSAGGAMAMAALRNYPKDFDGAVAGTATTGGSNWSPYIIQYLLRHPDSWLSPAKLRTLESAVNRACAGPDGLVRDPKACGFEPGSLLCPGAETDQCLTPGQIALANVISGPYPVAYGKTREGFSMTMPTGWSMQIGGTPPTLANAENPWAPGPPPLTFAIANSVFRSTFVKDAQFDFVKDARFDDPAFWARIGGGMSDDISKDPIWSFRKAGGKMIGYSGLGENMAPPFAEAEFYDAARRMDAGIDSFLRVYELPGVMHCQGGPGPQDGPERLLDAMIAWVEKGKAPGPVIANRPSSPPPGTTLICPYPKRARFVGSNGAAAYDARNWRCD